MVREQGVSHLVTAAAAAAATVLGGCRHLVLLVLLVPSPRKCKTLPESPILVQSRIVGRRRRTHDIVHFERQTGGARGVVVLVLLVIHHHGQ